MPYVQHFLAWLLFLPSYGQLAQPSQPTRWGNLPRFEPANGASLKPALEVPPNPCSRIVNATCIMDIVQKYHTSEVFNFDGDVNITGNGRYEVQLPVDGVLRINATGRLTIDHTAYLEAPGGVILLGSSIHISERAFINMWNSGPGLQLLTSGTLHINLETVDRYVGLYANGAIILAASSVSLQGRTYLRSQYSDVTVHSASSVTVAGEVQLLAMSAASSILLNGTSVSLNNATQLSGGTTTVLGSSVALTASMLKGGSVLLESSQLSFAGCTILESTAGTVSVSASSLLIPTEVSFVGTNISLNAYNITLDGSSFLASDSLTVEATELLQVTGKTYLTATTGSVMLNAPLLDINGATIEAHLDAQLLATAALLNETTVIANRTIRTVAEAIWIDGAISSLESTGDISITSPLGLNCSSFRITGNEGGSPQLVGALVQVACPGGTLSLAGAQVRGRRAVSISGTAFMMVDAPPAAFSAISTPLLTITATSLVEIQSQFPDTAGRSPEISIICPGTVTLGTGNGRDTWAATQLMVFGGSINVSVGTLRTEPNSTSCGNKPVPRADVCPALAQTPFPQDHSTLLRSLPSGLYFDFVLVAQEELIVGLAATSVYVASALLCSAGTVQLQQTEVRVNGRGCGPGQGSSAGHAPPEPKAPAVPCGAGGGSGVGVGGTGGTWSRYVVTTCSADKSGPRPPPPLSDLILPTSGASGGGCPYNGSCLIDRPSRWDTEDVAGGFGGGLIWLSANGLGFLGTVSLQSHGRRGHTVQDAQGNTFTSGGGAGGQILLFLSGDITTDPDGQVEMSAIGGDNRCTRQGTISGSGGGGFIGINWKSPPSATARLSVANAVNLSVSNGEIFTGSGDEPEDKCAFNLEAQSLSHTYGLSGVAAALVPCQGGEFGPFCAPCAIGYWSPAASPVCLECRNSPGPKVSQYTHAGWSTSDCPYECMPWIQNVGNPHCYNPFEYTLNKLGGMPGVAAILSCLVLASALLLFRRAIQKPRFPNAQAGDSFVDTTMGAATSRCATCCAGSKIAVLFGMSRANANAARAAKGEVHFPKEHLPFHIGRVYLAGDNRRTSPWMLSGKVPDSVLVATEQCENLAAAITATAFVSRYEAIFETILWVYPPLVPLFALWRRWRRCRRVQAVLQRLLEGDGRETFWRPIRARMGSTSELSASFGCDAGATLGHLDFFDHRRSQLDWAPVDLKKEAWLLMAHGTGTFWDPISIDLADPIIQHLARTDFGAMAVCSVISTFNRVARMLHKEELLSPDESPLMQRLREKVEQCASQCGLSGHVQVLILFQRGPGSEHYLRHSRGHTSSRSLAEPSFSDMVSGANGISGTASQGQGSAAPEAHVRSSLLASAASVARSQPGTAKPEQARVSIADSASGAPAYVDAKLCLAFVDSTALLERSRPPRIAHRSMDRADPPALSSPLSHNALWESIEWTKQVRAEIQASTPSLAAHSRYGSSTLETLNETQASVELTPGGMQTPNSSAERERLPRPTRRLFADSFLRRRWWEDQGAMTPATVMLAVVVLVFIDCLCFFLVLTVVASTSGGESSSHAAKLAGFFWVLVPPMAQPFAILLGLAFLLTEHPRLGRLYACTSLYSCINSVSWLAVSILVEETRSSWAFDAILTFIVIVVKVLIYVTVGAHTLNLEWALDMGYMEASQADFLCRIFASEEERSQTLGRQVSWSGDGTNSTSVPVSRPNWVDTDHEWSGGETEGPSPSWKLPALSRSPRSSSALRRSEVSQASTRAEPSPF